MEIGTVISIILNVIALCFLGMQWYCSRKAKKAFSTNLSIIWGHARNIEATVSSIKEAAGNELVSGHATIESRASGIVETIDKFRRIYWKEEPRSNAK